MSKRFATLATMIMASIAMLGTAVAATEPSPSELTARSRATVDSDGYEQTCRFENFPEFELHYNDDEGRYGVYSIPAVELDKRHGKLEVRIAEDGSVDGTIHLAMSVWGDKPGGDRGSALIVGGRRFDLGSAGIGATTFVLPAEAISAMERASSVRLEMTFLDGVSAWNFKVDHLRYFRRALELSKWQCA
jgi:hypothetical protein